jgi:metal-sulfur cluster biosynthetic enzyme
VTWLGRLGALFDASEDELGTPPDAVEPGSAAETAREALRGVIDPELGVGIVDLGLIYGLDVDESRVRVAMTMTTPACPLGEMIRSEARAALEQALPGRAIEIRFVWRPPWTSDRMSLRARRELGLTHLDEETP